jgi:hypothetical protein
MATTFVVRRCTLLPPCTPQMSVRAPVGTSEHHLHHLDLAPLPFLIVYTNRRVLLADTSRGLASASIGA